MKKVNERLSATTFHRTVLACCCAAALAPAAAQAQAPSAVPSAAFDGRWAVSLVCEDVHDNGQLVKGYTYNFLSEIKEGRLTGQQGQPGLPSSLTLAGVVQADGTVEINANGRTGKPDRTVGRVQPSTPYSYRMRGTFTPVSGKATRVELRPCEATFFKQQ